MKLNGNIETIENIDQVFITIGQDKLKLKLVEYRQLFSSSSNWTIPLGIVVSLLIGICSAQFQDVWKIPKETVAAFVYFCFAASVFWLVYAIVVSVKNCKKKDIDALITKIKSEQ